MFDIEIQVMNNVEDVLNMDAASCSLYKREEDSKRCFDKPFFGNGFKLCASGSIVSLICSFD